MIKINKEFILFLRKWNFLILFIFFILILFFHYIFEGKLSLYSIYLSLWFLFFISLYKLILEIIILDKLYIRFINNILLNIDKYIIRKNKKVILVIYYILYYFPTNWPYLIILWIGRKWWDIKLYLNSNKDVFFMKYFKLNLSKWVPFDFNKSWIKKNVINVFLRVLFVPTFFKLSLFTRNWTVFFIVRIFGIVYSAVLIVNNLHIFAWFKTTGYISFKIKILICVIILYIILYFLPRIVEKMCEFRVINDLKITNFNKGRNFYWIFLIDALKEENIIKGYFEIKEFLIFFLIKDWYVFFICSFYNKFYFINHKSEMSLSSNLIRLGKFDYTDLNLKDVLKENVIQNMSFFEIIWIYEKNYKYSVLLYGYIIIVQKSKVVNYTKILDNYSLFKILFGEEIVKEYFEEEVNEFENILFIITVWYKGYSENIKLEELNVPLNFNKNMEYMYILNLSNFLSQYYITWLPFLDYKANFKSSVTLGIIMYDSLWVFESFKTKEELINFYIKTGVNLENEYTKLKLEIFDSNLYKNTNDRRDSLQLKGDIYYNNKVKYMSFLEIIEELQNNHKLKYSNIKYKSPFFLDNVKMKKEWEIFDERKQ